MKTTLMAVFEYDPIEEEGEKEEMKAAGTASVSASDNGTGYKQLRIYVPKDVAEASGIEGGDTVLMEAYDGEIRTRTIVEGNK